MLEASPISAAKSATVTALISAKISKSFSTLKVLKQAR